MARLNEPAVPTESIDALKRRFVRQNREIARANSSQSLRIRTLETEVSRLLGENIALREQVINLTQDAERERSSRRLGNDVLDVKGRLEAKLADLGSLMQELGELPQKRDKALSRQSASGTGGERTSPDARNWKNTMSLSEVTTGQRIDHGQERRLPIIVEDKCYPRRTMDAEEILGVISASNNGDSIESPDLGPPPVAHFDEEEPIKFDPEKKESKKEIRADLVEDETTLLPPNLETRRKRRDSSSVKGSSAGSLNLTTDLSRSNNVTSGNSLKSGAKRKLSMLIDVDQTEKPISPIEAGFQFNRKKVETVATSPKREGGDKKTAGMLDVQKSSPGKAKPSSLKSDTANRRVLGPKSTNADPTSPSKIAKASVSDKIAELKKDVARQSKARQQERAKKNAVVTSIESQVNFEEKAKPVSEPKFEAAELPPKTPAGLDLFSPLSTEPSARPESRDTPPPTDLQPSASTNETNGTFGRASRRPRGTVSYAEPNLRDKMRRPTKDLADAVTGFQRASSVKIDDESEEVGDAAGKTEKGTMTTVIIKKEDSSERPEGPADLAGSPLGPRSNGSTLDLPTTVLTDRRRRVSTAPKLHEPPREDDIEVSAATLAEAIEGAIRVDAGQRSQKDLDTALIRLDIFEGPSSSPQPETAPAQKPITASKASRRHSAMPGPTRRAASVNDENKVEQDQSISKATGPRPRTLNTRPERASHKADQVEMKAGDVESLKSNRSIASLKDPLDGSRADRAAARRRSMMV